MFENQSLTSAAPTPEADTESAAVQPHQTTTIQPPSAITRAYPTIQLTRASISTGYAELTRRIGRGCSTAVDLKAAGAAVFSCLPTRSPIPDTEWRDLLTVHGSFGDIEISQGARLLRGLTGVDIGSTALTEQNEWMQAALIGRLGSTPLAAVQRVSASGVADASDLFIAYLVLKTARHAVVTPARASAAVWLEFFRGADWQREHSSLPNWLQIPFDLPVRLARHTLPARAVRTLRCGDVILPHSSYFDRDGNGVVKLGKLQASVQFDTPCHLQVISLGGSLENQFFEDDDLDDEEQDSMQPLGEQQTATRMQASDDAEQDDDDEDQDDDDLNPMLANPQESAPASAVADATLDQVPVTLDFMLGRLRLSLGALRGIDIGTVLTLEDGSPASIAIVAGGRTLGRGEVVDVNGQLGIRVIEWGAMC